VYRGKKYGIRDCCSAAYAIHFSGNRWRARCCSSVIPYSSGCSIILSRLTQRTRRTRRTRTRKNRGGARCAYCNKPIINYCNSCATLDGLINASDVTAIPIAAGIQLRLSPSQKETIKMATTVNNRTRQNVTQARAILRQVDATLIRTRAAILQTLRRKKKDVKELRGRLA
jgi:DNA-directed RNA polymerase beta' subunit